MRNFDFAPLYRSTVGFDRLATLFDSALSSDVNATAYPPYNIEKFGDDKYRITLAVAGFSQDDLDVQVADGELTVTAKKQENSDEKNTCLHRGIATRAFQKRFQLADHVRPVGAQVINGLLHIDLVREVPEALKPRVIEITSADSSLKASRRKVAA